jgi:phosphatidylglycerophosphatase A
LDYVKERDPALKEGFTLLLSSWFGVGRLPLAPGTWGTLGAVPLVLIISCFGPVTVAISLAVIITLAVWTSGSSQKLLGKDDPPEVVIDEVAGYFVTVFLLPFSWWGFILGFLLFRIFDILKPFPIRTIDKNVKGGIGICLDDIVAGIYANVGVRLLSFLWFIWFL